MAKNILRNGASWGWFFLLAGSAALLPGCGGNTPQGAKGAPKANPPPSKAPVLDAATAWRPTYDFAKARKPVTAGTGFVIVEAGALWFFTAAHVLEPRQWQGVQEIHIHSMNGKQKIVAPANYTYLGVGFDELPDLPSGLPDTTKDLMFLRLDDSVKLRPLKLAAAEPKAGDWVWVVGSEFRPEGDMQKAYLCQVEKAAQGSMSLTMRDRFQLRGFSGGPVLNQNGEVVGNLLGGDDKQGMALGATNASIRQRLQEKGILLK